MATFTRPLERVVSSDTLLPSQCDVGDVLTDPNEERATLLAQDTVTGAKRAVSLGGVGQGGYVQRIERVRAVAVAGQNGFFVPWGVYLRAADVLQVLVNGSSAAFAPMLRQAGAGQPGWPQPTTADVVRGVWLSAACTGGEVVEVEYRARTLLVLPPEPMVIFAPGAVLPTQLVPNPGQQIPNSYQPTHPFPPNALLLPQREGLQVELHRRSRRLGRFRQSLAVPGLYQIRQSRHFSPFWRTAVAGQDGSLIVDPFTEFFTASSWRANYFRLAYYDPATGARSTLSARCLVAQRRDDRIPGTPPPTHPANSLWIAGR